MRPPAITFDPLSWLVQADWLEEYGNREDALARLWRWRAKIARLLGVHADLRGDFVPGFTGVFTVGAGELAVDVYVVKCPRTWRITLCRPNLVLLPPGYVWMLAIREPSRYYRRRIWELAARLDLELAGAIRRES